MATGENFFIVRSPSRITASFPAESTTVALPAW
jgi:hypothetical protein